MRGENGIRALKEEVERLIKFIEDLGTKEESEDEDIDFANDVVDTLSWVLVDISNKDFRKDPYLNMTSLESIVKNIEERTGQRLEEHQ